MEIAAAAAASQVSCSTFAVSKIPHDPPTPFFYWVTAVAQPGPPSPRTQAGEPGLGSGNATFSLKIHPLVLKDKRLKI